MYRNYVMGVIPRLRRRERGLEVGKIKAEYG